MPYLLDADWIIDALAGRRRAAEAIEKLSADGISISWVTVGEVYEGAFRSPDPQADLDMFREFLRPFQIIDLNEPIVERFAQIRFQLRRRGELIPDLDLILGATALYHDLTVLTNNLRHLGRIPGLRLYRRGRSAGSCDEAPPGRTRARTIRWANRHVPESPPKVLPSGAFLDSDRCCCYSPPDREPKATAPEVKLWQTVAFSSRTRASWRRSRWALRAPRGSSRISRTRATTPWNWRGGREASRSGSRSRSSGSAYRMSCA